MMRRYTSTFLCLPACFALAASFVASALYAQEDIAAVQAAKEGGEIQQEIHPMLQSDGPYEATWESLDAHKTPQWFLDDKIGLSMHWGPYAVPAWAVKGGSIGPDSYSEWYMYRLYSGNHPTTNEYHNKQYGPDFHYDDFIPMFTAENFDADEWMQRLVDNGFKYFFITAKHHDGFCLWDTKYTNRNSVKMGPKRDILRELVDAARKHGIRIGFYYSYYEWHNPIYLEEYHGRGGAEKREVLLKAIEGLPHAGLIDHDNYVDDFMIPQIVELIDNFQPDYLCFDGEWDYQEPYWKSKQIAAYYYNQAAKRGQEVVMNDRFGKGTRGKRGDFFHVEYHYGADADRTLPWANWRGFGKSFGYNANEDPDAYLSLTETIRTVVECVSGNGNAEFNVGPTRDGRIDSHDWERILAMGDWLKVNGEAIYGATSNPLHRLDFRRGKATYKPENNTLYLHVYQWPENGIIELRNTPNRILSAKLLAHPDRELEATRIDDAMIKIKVPHHPSDPHVSVLALEYEGELEVKTW